MTPENLMNMSSLNGLKYMKNCKYYIRAIFFNIIFILFYCLIDILYISFIQSTWTTPITLKSYSPCDPRLHTTEPFAPALSLRKPKPQPDLVVSGLTPSLDTGIGCIICTAPSVGQVCASLYPTEIRIIKSVWSYEMLLFINNEKIYI